MAYDIAFSGGKWKGGGGGKVILLSTQSVSVESAKLEVVWGGGG